MASQNYVIQWASIFWKRQTPVMRGIVLMCLSTVAFSIMHGLVRFVSEVLPPFQIAFFRNVFGLAFLLPLLMRSRFAVLRTKQIGLHALRGVINMAAMLMFFTALSISPIARLQPMSSLRSRFVAVFRPAHQSAQSAPRPTRQ